MVSLTSSQLPPLAASVRNWLWFFVGMVVLMIIIGALTRLTGSGLSMTDWRPITGIFPPFTQEGWFALFERYKLTPQYRELNFMIDLAGFKSIFWLEYIHRVWGRVLGIVFILPVCVFAARRQIPTYLWPHLLGLLALGMIQAGIGWWMVKSGLTDRTTVSPYRLAVHLGIACTIVAWMIALLSDDYWRRHARKMTTPLPRVGLLGAFSLWIGFMILSGAIVAGSDAGYAYNDWPLMDGQIVPDGVWILNPWWRNFFENIAMVQLVHRTLAYCTIVFVVIVAVRHRDDGGLWLLIVAGTQALLGVITVIRVVPIDIATLHQLNAVILLSSCVWLWRRYRFYRAAS